MKIRMSKFAELVEDVHVCTGAEEGDHVPANCEGCGADATGEAPVYVWTTAAGVDYFSCGACLHGWAEAETEA